MNEKIIAMVLALMSACVPVSDEGLPKPEPTPMTESEYITEHFEITSVYLSTGEIEGYPYAYYTVYARNFDTGRTECIADDLSVEYLEESGEYWMITMYQRVVRTYKKGEPYYTGELRPVYD